MMSYEITDSNATVLAKLLELTVLIVACVALLIGHIMRRD